MGQNRGEIFEDMFKASVPSEAEVRKLATPGPRAQSMGQILDMLTRLGRLAGEEVPGWALATLGAASHTPKQPYDMLILAPAAASKERFESWWKTSATRLLTPSYGDGSNAPDLEEVARWGWEAVLKNFGGSGRDHAGAPMWHAVRPTITFALELKSTGAQKSLPFERLKDHQEAGLAKAAAKGHVAGVVLEFPDVGPDGELYFIPIGTWLAYKRDCGRQSLPLEAARMFGQHIALNPNRGRKHRYWKVGAWLRHYGADVPSEI